MTKDHDFDLDALLAEASDMQPRPSESFLQDMRILAVDHTPDGRKARNRSMLSGWFQILGGWPAGAGLAMAALGGVMIGINPPADIATYAAVALDTPDVWELSGYATLDFAVEEGLNQ